MVPSQDRERDEVSTPDRSGTRTGLMQGPGCGEGNGTRNRGAGRLAMTARAYADLRDEVRFPGDRWRPVA
ncbi:MAG: hypothetical protein NTV68_06560 [Methanomicrobiales archaeon]|nr:hypothetical protein [Methanomicrobiales archaeon]